MTSVQRKHFTLPHIEYRPDVDGLRAVAVLLVVGYHVFPNWIQGGFIGVDIFFVISGFLISTIILRNLEAGHFSYSEFYARRIRRIFPALILVLSVSYVIGWYVLLADEYRQLGKHITGGTSFVSNFFLWKETGYFDSEAESKPLLHLWSLGIEEQFYIFWPLLLVLTWKWKRGFFIAMLAMALTSFLANVYVIGHNPSAAFYSPLTRFWELLVGGTLALLTLDRQHVFKENTNWISFAGVALIVAGVLLVSKRNVFPGWWALLPTTGAFLIISVQPNAWVNRHLLSNRFFVWVGLISYPLYLWHWPLLSFARIMEGGVPSSGVRVMVVSLSIFLAWLTYVLIERKIRASRTLLLLIVLVVLALSLFVMGGVAWKRYLPPRNNPEGFGIVVKAMGDMEYPRGFEAMRFDGHTFFVKQASGENGNVIFFGDSHIAQYSARINKLLGEDPEGNKSAIFASEGGCPPIPNVHDDHHVGCEPFRSAAMKYLLSKEVDSVVVGACWNCYLTGETKEDRQNGGGRYEYYYLENGIRKYLKSGDGISAALFELESFLKSIARHKKVFLLLDNPQDRQNHPKSLFDGTRLTRLTYPSSEKSLNFDEVQKHLREQLVGIAKRAGATIIDPTALLCVRDRCRRTLEDGTPVYSDSNHLRASYVEKFANYMDIAVSR